VYGLADVQQGPLCVYIYPNDWMILHPALNKGMNREPEMCSVCVFSTPILVPPHWSQPPWSVGYHLSMLLGTATRMVYGGLPASPVRTVELARAVSAHRPRGARGTSSTSGALVAGWS